MGFKVNSEISKRSDTSDQHPVCVRRVIAVYPFPFPSLLLRCFVFSSGELKVTIVGIFSIQFAGIVPWSGAIVPPLPSNPLPLLFWLRAASVSILREWISSFFFSSLLLDRSFVLVRWRKEKEKRTDSIMLVEILGAIYRMSLCCLILMLRFKFMCLCVMCFLSGSLTQGCKDRPPALVIISLLPPLQVSITHHLPTLEVH